MFEKTYSKNETFFREKPSLLIFNHRHLFPRNLSFLDLGCGQGQDMLFMNKMGHKCLGVDISPTAIRQIREKIKKEKLKNIEANVADILSFNLSEGSYDIINLYNVLQCLKKNEAQKIIRNVQENVNKGGYVIISAFTVEDSYYLARTGEFKSFFDKKELLNCFSSEFKIIYYFEGLIRDRHRNYMPHQHGIVMLIAQKK